MLSSRSLQVNIGSEQPQREDGTHLWTDHKKVRLRTSLVVQWLRILLPMQGMWVQSLVRELRSHMCCALSLSHVQLFDTPWTSACQGPLPTLWSSWACTLKLERSLSGQKKKKKRMWGWMLVSSHFQLPWYRWLFRERLLQLWKATS